MEKQRIKQMLPDGSYSRIAKAVGVTEGTVAQFFADSGVRVSKRTRHNILVQANLIIVEVAEAAKSLSKQTAIILAKEAKELAA